MKQNLTCTEERCDRKVLARNLCNKHYTRWYREAVPAGARGLRKPFDPTATTKVCGRCRRELPVGDFHRADHTRSGYRYTCKVCTRLSPYGLSRDSFEEMIEAQGGRCPICGTNEPGSKGWVVDHDHSCCSGRTTCGRCVRMLLCECCNSGLGYFRDNPDTLEAAYQYLKKFT